MILKRNSESSTKHRKILLCLLGNASSSSVEILHQMFDGP